MFINRTRELKGLNERYDREQAELFVIYGRRRIGKSALLQEFCRDKGHVYFLATQVRERDNLDQFREVLAAAYPDPLLDSLNFTSWENALAYFVRLSQEERTVLVLDEFPYLCQDNPALPSILQKWWDLVGKMSKIVLILCGSQVSFMEQEVLAERSALFGRRTGQERLGPLLPWETSQFFPHYTVRDRLTAYCILGGVPAYLERMDPSKDLKTNLMREALSSQGFLFDEVNFLLRTELTQITTYMTVLKAVAGGATRISEIATRAGIPATAASRYLGTLRELGIIRRDVPFTESHPEKSKKGLYVVGDPFVAFWCRFILPHQSLIQAGQGETVWREFIEPGLDTWLGGIFEQICRLYVLHRWSGEHGPVPLRVGRMWSGSSDVDVMAELADGNTRGILVGECKWWKAPAGLNVLNALSDRVRSLPSEYQLNPSMVIFSLSGFTDELREAAEARKLTLVDGEKIGTDSNIYTQEHHQRRIR